MNGHRRGRQLTAGVELGIAQTAVGIAHDDLIVLSSVESEMAVAILI